MPHRKHKDERRKVEVKEDSKLPKNTRLRNARFERGWSQEKLAEYVGTTSVNVSRWENGFNFPSPFYRMRLSELFSKSVAELGLLPPSFEHKIVSILNQRNPFFTGRESLLKLLHERLSTTRTVALMQPQQVQALFGLGGIGKTQAAAEYAFRYISEYAHIFWIRAASRDLLVADLVEMAQQLDLPEKGAQDSMRVVVAVKRWLTVNPDWLLILDNADDLPLAHEFLPNRHNGSILLTTRAHASGAVAVSIEVHTLQLQDGIELLVRRSKLLHRDMPLGSISATDYAAAERIVQEMDGLPLAIVQAGAFVEETGCSLADYLNLYKTHRKDLLARKSRLSQDYKDTVYTTWSLTFEQVEQQNPAAANILRLCAFLAPDAIPEELLIRGAVELDESTRVAMMDALKFNEVLEVLRTYSLVRRNGKTHMLSIHRLVQAVLKESMDQETQRLWAERTVCVVNSAFPESNYGDVAKQQYYLQYYVPHIQECATLIERYRLHFPEAAQLLFQAGAFLYDHGFYPRSKSFYEQALSIREQVLGPEHLTTAESFNYLGVFYRNQGDYKQAEKFHSQALAIREKILGLQHPKTAQSLNNLGVLYRNQERYELAEPLLQQAFIIRNLLLGSEHPHTLTTSINLAKLYLEQKQYMQARQLLEQALATCKQVLGPENPHVAQNLHLLARLLYEQEMYELAEIYWKRAIEIIENMLGPEHPAIAESLNGLAGLFFAQNRLTEAQSLCQRALYISENTFDAKHPDTITYRKHLTEITNKIEKE